MNPRKCKISAVLFILALVAIGIYFEKAYGSDYTCHQPLSICTGPCPWTCICVPVATSMSPAGGCGGLFLKDPNARDCGTCLQKWTGFPCFRNCGPGLAQFDDILCP
jgi:hypothetical protein